MLLPQPYHKSEAEQAATSRRMAHALVTSVQAFRVEENRAKAAFDLFIHFSRVSISYEPGTDLAAEEAKTTETLRSWVDIIRQFNTDNPGVIEMGIKNRDDLWEDVRYDRRKIMTQILDGTVAIKAAPAQFIKLKNVLATQATPR